jgi:hypothetical protein
VKAGSIAGLALAACAPSPIHEALPLDGAASVVVAHRRPGEGSFSLIAARADRAVHFEAEDLPSEVVVMAFAEPLEVLELPAGPVLPSCGRPCGLLEPTRVLGATLERDDRDTNWRPIEAPPAVLDPLVPDRVGRCSAGCVTYSQVELTLGSTMAVRFALADGEDGALLGLADGRLLHLRAGGAIEERCLAGDFVPTAAARDGDRLWIATHDLRLGLLRLSTISPTARCAFEEETTSAAGETILRIAAGADGRLITAGVRSTSPGVYTRGVAAVFDGLTLVASAELALDPFDSAPVRSFAGALWLPDGRAVAATGADELAWFEGDGFTVEQVEAEMTRPRIQSLALGSQGSLLLGAIPFGLLERQGERWVALSSYRGAQGVGLIFPSPDRIVLTLAKGVLTQWVRGLGMCPEQSPGYNGSPTVGLELTGGRLLIGNAFRGATSETRAVMLTPQAPACPR